MLLKKKIDKIFPFAEFKPLLSNVFKVNKQLTLQHASESRVCNCVDMRGDLMTFFALVDCNDFFRING